MWTGKPVENATQTLATETAKQAGAGPLTAGVIGTAVDMAAGGPSGGVKKASEKFAKEMAEEVFKDGKNLERELNDLERGATLPEGTHKIQETPNARISGSNKPSEILEAELDVGAGSKEDAVGVAGGVHRDGVVQQAVADEGFEAADRLEAEERVGAVSA